MNIILRYIDSKIPDDVPKPWVFACAIWLLIVLVLLPLLYVLSSLKIMLLYRLVFIITFILTLGFIGCAIMFLYGYFTGKTKTWR